MKSITVLPNFHHFKNDIERLIKIFKNKNYKINKKQAYQLWHRYSQNARDCTWVKLPLNDEHIWCLILPYWIDKSVESYLLEDLN